MKFLSVVWFKVLPPHFGGQKGTTFFNRGLADLAWLACLCSRNNEQGKERYEVVHKLPTSRFQFLNPFTWWKIYQTAKRKEVTHLILEYPYHGLAAILTKSFLKIKLIVHEHNIESIRFKNLGKWWWGPLYHYEKWTLKQANLVFFKTKSDRDFAIKRFGLQPKKLLILPYGVEKQEETDKETARKKIMERHGIPEGNRIILFAGTLDYAPNEQAVLTIHYDIVPWLRKNGPEDFTILICGRNRFKKFQYLKQFKTPGVIYAGETDDIDSYFAAADVFINPVMEGGGVQTKNIDALSHHCNLVCLKHTLAGVPVELCARKIFTVEANHWEQFSRRIREACLVKENTPEAFFEQLSWKNIAHTALDKIKEAER